MTPIPENRARVTAWSAAAATRGRVARVKDDGYIAIGVTTDSRAVREGMAFVALRGPRHDGHDFLEKAMDTGAALVVVERGRAPSGGRADVVEVEDTLTAWGDLARAHLRDWRRARAAAGSPSRVVAITGSAGKTTVKELTRALLGTVASVHATAGNLNNRVGLPAVAFEVDDTHEFAVFEAGMSVRGEIAELARIAEPDVAVITNIGLAHADGVGGSRGDVAREKGALFAALGREGVAVANIEDEAVMGELSRSAVRHAETFGVHPASRYCVVRRVPLGLGGSRVALRRPTASREMEVTLPLLGDAAAVNLAAAAAAAEAACGHPLGVDDVESALAALAPTPGRMFPRALADGTLLLDDSYNANPASMQAALRTLVEVGRERGRPTVVVLGEMKELGPRSPGEHELLGFLVAESGVRLAIGCGGMADLVLERAKGAGVTVAHGQSSDDAAGLACTLVGKGDVVLVKGSRSVATERVVEALVKARGEKAPGEAGG